MARWLLLLAVLAVIGAGCSDSAKEGAKAGADFGGLGLDATDTTGIVRGVVVDERIVPVEGAGVRLRGEAEERITTTDAEGRFGFDGLRPGTYFLTVGKLNHEAGQTTAEVRAGVDEPTIVRVLIARLSAVEPFSQLSKFEGFIQCGYSVEGVISFLCLNDYETLVVPDIPPTLKEVFDSRGYVTALDGNWSTLVFELTWEPSAQGTSPEMFELVSFWNRTASDAYARLGGAPPAVVLRLESGEVGPGQQGCCDMVPPEGIQDLYVWAGIQTESGGPPAAVGFSQDFTIFQTNFFHAKPPEGWSYVAGDPPPF